MSVVDENSKENDKRAAAAESSYIYGGMGRKHVARGGVVGCEPVRTDTRPAIKTRIQHGEALRRSCCRPKEGVARPLPPGDPGVWDEEDRDVGPMPSHDWA